MQQETEEGISFPIITEDEAEAAANSYAASLIKKLHGDAVDPQSVDYGRLNDRFKESFYKYVSNHYILESGSEKDAPVPPHP